MRHKEVISFPAQAFAFVRGPSLPLALASAWTHGHLHLKMRGQMGKEKGARGIRSLAAVGHHLLFVNSGMWPPAVSFKLGETCVPMS